MIINSEIGDKIKYLRKEILNFSQKELSEKLGITLNYLSNLENGKRYLSQKIINKLDLLTDNKDIILSIRNLIEKETQSDENDSALKNEEIDENKIIETSEQLNLRLAKEELLKEIKKVREIELNLTQKELSDKLGVGRSYISLIESGKSIPSMKILRKIYALTDKKEIPKNIDGIMRYLKNNDNDFEDKKIIPDELAFELSNLFKNTRTKVFKLSIDEFAPKVNLLPEELESIENSNSIPNYYTVCLLFNLIKKNDLPARIKLILIELESKGIDLGFSFSFMGIEDLHKNTLFSLSVNTKDIAIEEGVENAVDLVLFHYNHFHIIHKNYKMWIKTLILIETGKKELAVEFLNDELKNIDKLSDETYYGEYKLLLNSELAYIYLLIGKEKKSKEVLNQALEHYNFIKESKHKEVILTYKYLAFIHWELFLLGDNKKEHLNEFISDIKQFLLEIHSSSISLYQSKTDKIKLYLKHTYFKIIPFFAKAHLFLAKLEDEQIKQIELINNGELFLTLVAPEWLEPKEKWFEQYYYTYSCFFSLKSKLLSLIFKDYDITSDLNKSKKGLEIFLYSLFRQDKNNYKKIFEQWIKDSNELEFYKTNRNYMDVYKEFE